MHLTPSLSKMHAIRSIVFAGLLAIIVGCGGGKSSSDAGSTPPPPPPPQVTVLPGSGSSSAVSVLAANLASPAAQGDSSHGYLLTRLIVLLKPNATVDQFNAAARQVSATRILTSRNGFALLTLEVPRQPSVAALMTLAKTLRSQLGIAAAFPARTLQPSMLPTVSSSQPASSFSHLLASRFPQAWNAHTAEGLSCTSPLRRVPIYVMDYFGSSDTILAPFLSEAPINVGAFAADQLTHHGARVALAIAGRFDSIAPTGADPFPHCAQLHLVEDELQDPLTSSFALSAALVGESGHFIINSSLNFSDPFICGESGTDECTLENGHTLEKFDVQNEIVQRVLFADALAVVLKDTGDRMLITTSAGNVQDGTHLDVEGSSFFALRYAGFRDARFGNPFALATHLTELDTLLQDADLWKNTDFPLASATFDAAALDNLHTLLQQLGTGVIDSNAVLIADSGTSAETLNAVGASNFDFLGADIRAVAEGVRLVGGDAFDTFSGSGTSLAAAQVAGMAAYLWTISSELASAPPAETRRHILRTARAATGLGLLGVPLLDAYAATLAVDKPNGPRKVRHALLDANDDGLFDQRDLTLFADAYKLSDPNAPTIPTARDFSRFDLNGDGYTGGILIGAFDLDVDALDARGLPRINTVDEQIEGYPITFNEAALSDLQILCFYAYSSLYASDNGGLSDQTRTSLLGPDHCVGARLNIQLPAQVSSSATLTTTLELPAGHGQFALAPNMLVELTPTCATVSPTSARTDANGAISVTVTANSGCSSLSIQVVARADIGTTPLAQQLVNATVSIFGTFVAEVDYHATITARDHDTGIDVFPREDADASNSSFPNPTLGPIDLTHPGSFHVMNYEPTNYTITAHGDGPIAKAIAGTGTFTGSSGCSANGNTAMDNDGNTTFPAMPDLRSDYSGSLTVSVPAGLSFAITGSMARTENRGTGQRMDLTGLVTVRYFEGGGAEQTEVFRLGETTGAAVPFNTSRRLAAPASLTIEWRLTSECFLTSVVTGIDAARKGTITLGYSLSN